MSTEQGSNVLLEVASLAMRLGGKYVEPYSHQNSPQRFTQRQRSEEGQYRIADAVVGQYGGGRFVRSVERPRLTKEPVVVVFAMA